MQYTTLGKTGIRVSRLAFGAGPVAGVMIGDNSAAQLALVERVLQSGINWIDTAPGYGNGRAELAVGTALETLDAHSMVHIATKVRVSDEDLPNITAGVRASFAASLKRLRAKRVTLLQIHNSVTERRGDEPSSVTPADVLGPGGVLEALEKLRDEGSVRYLGLTGIGHAGPLGEVIDSGRFDTIQVPYSPMNPSAGLDVPDNFQEANYGNAIGLAARQGMGIFVIRVLAGGVMASDCPSAHTLQTKFFPLDLFERDRVRVERLRELLPPNTSLKELAMRYALSHTSVASAIVGFSEPVHVDEAVSFINFGPVDPQIRAMINELGFHYLSTDRN